MNQFKNLLVWKKGMDLVVEVYAHTNKFPDKEKFGLINQITRSAVSIVSNIAEGAGRNSEKEFNNFLGVALGSTCELETQLLIAHRLNYIDENTVNRTIKSIEEIQKMLVGLQKSIKQNFQTS